MGIVVGGDRVQVELVDMILGDSVFVTARAYCVLLGCQSVSLFVGSELGSAVGSGDQSSLTRRPISTCVPVFPSA